MLLYGTEFRVQRCVENETRTGVPCGPTHLPLGCREGTCWAGIRRVRPEHPPFTSLGLLHRAPAPGPVPPWRSRGGSRGNAVPTPPPGVKPDGRVRKKRRLPGILQLYGCMLVYRTGYNIHITQSQRCTASTVEGHRGIKSLVWRG